MHSSRYAKGDHVGRNVINDDRARTNHRVIAHTLTGKHDGADPNLGKVSDLHSACNHTARSQMRIAANTDFVFDDSSGVNNCSVADAAFRIQDGAWHDHHTRSDASTASDDGAGMNRCNQLSAKARDLIRHEFAP